MAHEVRIQVAESGLRTGHPGAAMIFSDYTNTQVYVGSVGVH